MTAVCRAGKLALSCQLADDLPTPAGSTAFGLATDDLVALSRRPLRAVHNIMRQVDAGFSAVGVNRHEGKDFTGLHRCPGLGVTVKSAHRAIHDTLWDNVLQLLGHVGSGGPFLTPQAALAALLGHEPPGLLGEQVVHPISDAPLLASDVDILPHSGLVDPLPYLPEELQSLVVCIRRLFVCTPHSASGFRAVPAATRRSTPVWFACNC